MDRFEISSVYEEEPPKTNGIKGGEPTEEEMAEAFERMYMEEWRKET